MFEMLNMAQTFVDILSGRRNNLKKTPNSFILLRLFFFIVELQFSPNVIQLHSQSHHLQLALLGAFHSV